MIPSERREKRVDIQWLRALAVIAVILFHLDDSLVPGGFLGVDIFFVISGFLITQILLREIQQGNFTIASFYLRRVKRIFPALITMLFVMTIVAILFIPQFHFKGLLIISRGPPSKYQIFH